MDKISRMIVIDPCTILFQITSDSVIIFPTHRVVQLIAENTDQPIYFYMFSYQGRYSIAMWNETTPYGITFILMLFIFYDYPKKLSHSVHREI